MPSDTYTLTISEAGVSIPSPHASSHITGGSDVIPTATSSTSGLMSATIYNQHVANTAALAGSLTAANLAGGAIGTIPYQTASGSTSMLSAGTSGYVLTANGSAAPTWAPVSLSAPSGTLAVEDGGTGVSTFTAGVVYADGTNDFTTVTKPTGDLVGTSASQTLTNKTLGSGTVFSSPIGVASGGTGASTFTAGILKASGTTTFTTVAAPDGAVVGTTDTQTLTNKTLSTGTNLGTPDSGTLTYCTGLPLTTGVTGTLPVANGGTGVTTATGSGSVVLSTLPTLVTPILGTPTSGTLTNCTGLPLTSGVTGILPAANGGTGTSSSTGTGALVLASSPTLTTPTLNSPTFVTPVLGTPSSGTLTSCTGLPLTTGVTGTLPVDNGGTGLASYAVGDIIYADTTTSLSSLEGVATGNVLLSGGVDTAPAYGKVGLTTHVSGTLPVANGGTGYTSAVRGQVAKMSSFATHNVGTAGDYTVIATAGTLSAESNMVLGSSSTFSIKNDSGDTRLFRVYASVDATSSTNNQVLSIKLASGTGGSLVIIDDTQCNAFTGSTSEPAKLVTSWMISLADLQEVAIYLTNISGANPITIQRARLIAEAII